MATTPDLTIIYVTLNKHPESWARFHWANLVKATGDLPLWVIAPQSLGTKKWGVFNRPYNLFLDEGPYSHEHMYRMIVEAAKKIETPYIAIAEDDTLYTHGHFHEFRPKLDEVSYNMHRWSLYTWTGLFSVKNRISNCTLIAGREYYIEAWEERFKKFPDGVPPHRVSEIGRHNQERWMGVSERNVAKWYSTAPVIQLNHPNGTDSLGKKKRMGEFRAYDIPVWGKASDIIDAYV